MRFFRNQLGITMIQTLFGAGSLGALALAGTSYFQYQTKAQNGIEFHSRKEQLRMNIMGMFLANPDNCRCLFSNVSDFPAGGVSELTGVAGDMLGPYRFSTPGDCSSATIPSPFVSRSGVDGLISEGIQIKDVTPVSGGYMGNLTISLAYSKPVMGSQNLQLKIPVALSTAPAGAGTVSFRGCGSTDSSFSTVPMTFSTSCRHYMTCDEQANRLCAQQFTGRPYCMKSVYNTKVDAGKREFVVKGYQCTVGTCSNGTSSDSSGVYSGNNYNCGSNCFPDDAGFAANQN